MKKYWAPHVSEGGDTFYGYGWSIAKTSDGKKVFTHNGGNGIFFADMAIVPERGTRRHRHDQRHLGNARRQFPARTDREAFRLRAALSVDPGDRGFVEGGLGPFARTYRLTGDGGGFRDEGRPGSLY